MLFFWSLFVWLCKCFLCLFAQKQAYSCWGSTISTCSTCSHSCWHHDSSSGMIIENTNSWKPTWQKLEHFKEIKWNSFSSRQVLYVKWILCSGLWINKWVYGCLEWTGRHRTSRSFHWGPPCPWPNTSKAEVAQVGYMYLSFSFFGIVVVLHGYQTTSYNLILFQGRKFLNRGRSMAGRVVVQGPGPGPRYGHVMALVGQRFLVCTSGNDG